VHVLEDDGQDDCDQGHPLRAPRDLVFQDAVDVRFIAAVDVLRATDELNAAKAIGIPVRIAGATRRLQNLVTRERLAKASLEAAFVDAAREIL